MSGPVEGGESGDVAGVWREAEVESDPPQSAPPLSQGEGLELGENKEEEAPPAAKQPRLSGDGLELSLSLDPPDAHGGPIEQAGLRQEDLAVLTHNGGKVVTSCCISGIASFTGVHLSKYSKSMLIICLIRIPCKKKKRRFFFKDRRWGT